ncbi:chromosome segregation protein SMC [Rubrivirga sp. IMCC45206]|uniref:chromosome segregation protein SMC n=1 Tax=Rubrivirga sp. IMCC45206 TaxID=3391614 RepID=UPI00398FC143
MYLSRLDLHGFKSFAQKTSVDFSPGVTAIVGPNGCGKSNVIDAVRWVLGEQRSRLLRSDSMAGVIFNGAAGKKALGMAEVSLTVENTRGVLPTEFSEVTITRRLYRNGDSEYLLNGTTCRLRDILDLFMDTGMGAGAYSVIELSMVEDILSEQADDRRRLFEEAAGVTKYKRRRAQALRRLDATRGDLLRLDDIVEEVDKQVRSLSRQAQKAARHARFAERLRRLELAMAAYEVARLQGERETLEATVKTRGTEAEGLGATVAAGEAQLEQARTALVGLEQDMAAGARALQAHAETVQALESDVRLGTERQSAGRRALERIERERVADAARGADAAREHGAATERIEATAAVLAHRQTALDATEAARTEARDAADAARQKAQTAAADAGEAAAALRDAASAADRARDRRQYLTAEADRIAAERAALANAVVPDTTDADDGEAALADAERALAQATDARDATREAFEAADAVRQQAHAALGAARAQADLLAALVEAGAEGDSAVAFLAAHPDVDAPALAELVDADEPDRLALDAALGAFATALVVDTEDAADAAIGRLKAADRGRATFLVLSRIAASGERSPTPPGTTPALSLARADDRVQPLLAALLGNTFVADSLATARSLRDAYPVARFVTREGAWTDASGAVHGGSAAPSDAASRMGVRERQASAAEVLEAAEAAHAAAVARADDARADRDAAEAGRRAAEAARDAARKARDAAREASARARAEAAARVAQAERLAARADEVAAAIDALPDPDALEDAASETQLAASDAAARAARAEAARDAADADRRTADTAHADARLALAQAESAASAATDARDRADRTLAEVAQRQADRDAEAARVRAEIAESEGAEGETRARLDAERQRTDALQTAASASETAVLEGRARIADAERSLREIRSKREAAAAARADAERRLAEVTTRQETTLERLAEEHGADLDEAAAELDRLQVEELFQPDTARVEIPDLRQKIRAIGPVNALALEGYEEEKTRLAFLQEQRADLAAAETSLLETIREINETARRRFDETFTQVREAFQKLFADLFGGDAAADLSLDGDDPLEAPISITARPKGKRPVSLAQLSGGEKTLTATALLFAIYLVKPSPFCILDEVDAPLDDANVGRFMRLIRSFADSTQFILVTHNKLTMEAADRMYGVTMPTPGVSRLVGVRFEEEPAADVA